MSPHLLPLDPAFEKVPGMDIGFTPDASRASLLTVDYQALALKLHRRFEKDRKSLIQLREERHMKEDQGFLPETRSIREGNWQCAPPPSFLKEQRIELAAPATRKYLLNGLNSDADVFVAHFGSHATESANSPLDYQKHLRDAVNKSITFYDLDQERFYKLEAHPAHLMIAPRPWFKDESDCLADGESISAAWFDCSLFLFHNAHLLLAQGNGPCLYLAGLESRAEARLWREVLLFLESELALPLGNIKVSLLVESLPSLFNLHELIYELRDHTIAVGCGCRTQLPQGLEHLINHPELEIPASLRHGIRPSLEEVFVKYLIRTCKKRGILAIGCMGKLSPTLAQEPVQEALMAKFRADKVRESKAGFSGTRVEHPKLVNIARKEFERYSRFPKKNTDQQSHRVLLPSMNQFSVS